MTYQEFIDYNKTKDQGPFTEKHHIIPLSVGGSDTPDNIITLSWLAHWYAHKLIIQVYPEDKQLHRLSTYSMDRWLKRCWVTYSGNNMRGKKHTDETKRKISDKLTGKIGPNKGRHWSEEIKKKMSEAHKGQKAWNKGIKMPEELVEINKKSHIGLDYKHGPETGKLGWKIIDGKRVWYRKDLNEQTNI